MATTTLSVRYRPVRIGFLVEDGNINDLIEVAGINTLLWGGIYNPIIPLYKNIEHTELLIKSFNIDVLFPIKEFADYKSFFKNYYQLCEHSFFLHPMFIKSWNRNKYDMGYFDVLNIVNYYWEKEFKFAKEENKSNVTLIEWSKRDPLKNLFSLCFGYYPIKYQLTDDFKKTILSRLNSNVTRILSKKQLQKVLLNKIYPLALTRTNLIKKSHDVYYGKSFYIGNSNNFQDLINYWNLRASGIDIEFFPIENSESISRCENYIKAHFSNTFNRNKEISIPNQFYYLNKEQYEDIKRKIDIIGINGYYVHCKKDIWNYFIKPHSFHYFENKQVLASLDLFKNRYTISISLPEKPFIKDTNRNIDKQAIVFSITPYNEYEYLQNTLKPPYFSEFNDFYCREMISSVSELRIEKDGIGIITDIRNETLQLHPLSHQKIIRLCR